MALASAATSGVRCVRQARKMAKLRLLIEQEYRIGSDAVFKGYCVTHSGKPRFEWRPFDGDATVSSLLVFPSEAESAWLTGVPDGEIIDIEFSGRILERGRFGHKGRYHYRIEVTAPPAIARREPSGI